MAIEHSCSVCGEHVKESCAAHPNAPVDSVLVAGTSKEQPSYSLLDADTNAVLESFPSDDIVAASLAAGDTGIILVRFDGETYRLVPECDEDFWTGIRHQRVVRAYVMED